ncbi:MAG: DUF1887 family CARF protein [Bacteroidales bacterium]|jgi:hypothetical protein|nr:DUF1887 family CARF protein [Bacteroidales bacterium]
MNSVIVSIVSDQTIPNYLFIKQMINYGDELLFISSKEKEDKINFIEKTLNYKNCNSYSLILKDEENYKSMYEEVKSCIDKNKSYKVNLTCGTKLMAFAIKAAFEEYKNVVFFYIPSPKNIIINMNTNENINIEDSVNIAEYMQLYNNGINSLKEPVVSDENYTNNFYNIFMNDKLSNKDYQIISALRAYRNVKHSINIEEIENIQEDEETENKKKIEGLQEFLNKLNFPQKKEGMLDKCEIQYLTGGWFEEYIYFMIKNEIKPTDIALGLSLKNNTQQNDLDVVFTYGNKLFVIECKTGIDGEKIFNEIIYKSSSIQTILLGLSANSYIINCGTLGNKDGNKQRMSDITKNMKMKYYDKENLISNKEDIFKDIRKKANNN